MQRVGFEAFGAAAGFHSMEELMASPGAGAFVRASMRVQIAAETNGRGESDGG